MRLHFYGILNSLESCFTYQEFEIDGKVMLLQNSPRFGYEPATMVINNPAMFIPKGDEFYRFVIEDFCVDVKDGILQIEDSLLRDILGESDNYFG